MMRTAEHARGKWRGILLSLGAEAKHLSAKHGPCPFCGGNDRFRWDNVKGAGTFICSHCGAGDGFEFLRRLKQCTFKEAAALVDSIVGGVRQEPVRERDEGKDKQRLRDLWKASVPLQADDLAGQYLASRGVLPRVIPPALRFVAQCREPDGQMLPAMLAMVETADGQPATMHRTFLGPNGKADIAKPRALMAGPHPEGSAVRLFAPVDGRLGIAEGIETALAAAKHFQMPVWAALNARQLAAWVPPEGVTSVVVMGDNDASFTGQAAAYALANRLAVRGKIAVEVQIPPEVGTDWADVPQYAPSGPF